MFGGAERGGAESGGDECGGDVASSAFGGAKVKLEISAVGQPAIADLVSTQPQ